MRMLKGGKLYRSGKVSMLETSLNKESCVQLVHAGTDLGVCGSVHMQPQTSYDQP